MAVLKAGKAVSLDSMTFQLFLSRIQHTLSWAPFSNRQLEPLPGMSRLERIFCLCKMRHRRYTPFYICRARTNTKLKRIGIILLLHHLGRSTSNETSLNIGYLFVAVSVLDTHLKNGLRANTIIRIVAMSTCDSLLI